MGSMEYMDFMESMVSLELCSKVQEHLNQPITRHGKIDPVCCVLFRFVCVCGWGVGAIKNALSICY